MISDILRKWVSLNGITVSHREGFPRNESLYGCPRH